MKTVGIIGGLGPETTARFYMEVILGCSKLNNVRPSILISNVALPLQIEEDLIKGSGNNDSLPFLIDAAKQLEQGGADFIVIPCNTVHIFMDQIRDSVKIPVISIIEEASSFLIKNNIENVGILATQTTVKHGLFEILAKKGIKIHFPNKLDQAKLGKIIHRLVKNTQRKQDKNVLLHIIDLLSKKGVENILLACTDLQILISEHKKLKVFDTMDILAQATVREIITE